MNSSHNPCDMCAVFWWKSNLFPSQLIGNRRLFGNFMKCIFHIKWLSYGKEPPLRISDVKRDITKNKWYFQRLRNENIEDIEDDIIIERPMNYLIFTHKTAELHSNGFRWHNSFKLRFLTPMKWNNLFQRDE